MCSKIYFFWAGSNRHPLLFRAREQASLLSAAIQILLFFFGMFVYLLKISDCETCLDMLGWWHNNRWEVLIYTVNMILQKWWVSKCLSSPLSVVHYLSGASGFFFYSVYVSVLGGPSQCRCLGLTCIFVVQQFISTALWVATPKKVASWREWKRWTGEPNRLGMKPRDNKPPKWREITEGENSREFYLLLRLEKLYPGGWFSLHWFLGVLMGRYIDILDQQCPLCINMRSVESYYAIVLCLCINTRVESRYSINILSCNISPTNCGRL